MRKKKNKKLKCGPCLSKRACLYICLYLSTEDTNLKTEEPPQGKDKEEALVCN